MDGIRGGETDAESMNYARRFFNVLYLSFEATAILFFDSGFRHAVGLGRYALYSSRTMAITVRQQWGNKNEEKIKGNPHVLQLSNVGALVVTSKSCLPSLQISILGTRASFLRPRRRHFPTLLLWSMERGSHPLPTSAAFEATEPTRSFCSACITLPSMAQKLLVAG